MPGNADGTDDSDEGDGSRGIDDDDATDRVADDATDRIDERLRAVERAITDDDRAVADLADGATAAAERDALRERVSELESRVEELEAATQAVRGYVGSVRAVNREVERRADLALAAATEARSAGESRDGHEGALPDDLADSLPDDVPADEPAVAAAVPDDRRRTATDATWEDGSDATWEDGSDATWEDGSDAADGSSLGSETLSRLREVL